MDKHFVHDKTYTSNEGEIQKTLDFADLHA